MSAELLHGCLRLRPSNDAWQHTSLPVLRCCCILADELAHERYEGLGCRMLPSCTAALRRFRGKVLRQAGGFALVSYDDLQQDAGSEQPLLEWFLVPGSAGHDAAAVSTDDPIHEESGYLLRPEPPAEVCSHLLVRCDL